MVANNKTVGKLEKSNGLKVCNATIKINKDNSMLLVKNTSRRYDGNGITIMTIKIKIPKGKAKDFNFSIAINFGDIF